MALDKNIKLAALWLADYKCRQCADRDTDGLRIFQLENHHNEGVYPPPPERVGDLLVLCSRCHAVHRTVLWDTTMSASSTRTAAILSRSLASRRPCVP